MFKTNLHLGASKLGFTTLITLSLLGNGCHGGFLDVVDEVLKPGPCKKTGKCKGDTTTAPMPTEIDSTAAHTTTSAQNTTSNTKHCGYQGAQERQVACGRCGIQTQRCEAGKWNDIGTCENQKTCSPGEVSYETRPAKFQCGGYKLPFRCNEQCEMVFDDTKEVVFVTNCERTDCCNAPFGRCEAKAGNTNKDCRAPGDPEKNYPVMTQNEWDHFLTTGKKTKGCKNK